MICLSSFFSNTKRFSKKKIILFFHLNFSRFWFVFHFICYFECCLITSHPNRSNELRSERVIRATRCVKWRMLIWYVRHLFSFSSAYMNFYYFFFFHISRFFRWRMKEVCDIPFAISQLKKKNIFFSSTSGVQTN